MIQGEMLQIRFDYLPRGFFMRGEWRDAYLYSVLREEWKEPKILTKTPK